MSAVLSELAPVTNEQEIIDECQARFKLASEAESENRKKALHDLEFANGDQWPIDIKRDRDADARPCLTINITDAMVRRVTNALRENRPRIKFHPIGDGADVDTAKVRNGMMRHIEESSGADYAYDCATESAVRGGWGYVRVGSKYLNDRAFDQDLAIFAVPNPFTYYMDPSSTMPDGSDAQWAVSSHWMSRQEYRLRYHDKDPNGWQFLGPGDDIKDWANKEEIRVCEYWRIEMRETTLYQTTIGNLFEDELPSREQMMADGVEIVRKRKTFRNHVQWFLLSAAKVIDKRDWPGKWIPIIPVYGRQCNINGRIDRKGMTRDLLDPARMYNYAQTAKTEVYALMPKAPWMGVDGQTEGHEDDWRDANRKPIVFLAYKPVQLPDGTMAPPPMRQPPPQPNAGFAEWGESTRSDFLAVAGMPNDPGQDNQQGQVVSGVAIKRRQGMTDISHFDFADNLTRSLKHLGNVISDLIPYFYDTQRIPRIIGDDGTPSTTTINEKVVDPMTKAVQKVKNDMTAGLYDTVVDTGPAYATKREEASASMLQLLGTELGKQVAATSGDIVVRQMDFPEADAIADRIAVTIPGAQIDKESDIPPKAQMMIKSLQAQLQQATQKGMALEMELQAKTKITEIKEQGATARAHMAAVAHAHDTEMRTQTTANDTHVRAITALHDTNTKADAARDVASINVEGKILDTHLSQEHERAMTKEALRDADVASHKND